MSLSTLRLRESVRALEAGGVIAYPTEAVWGLGCDPFNEQAVERLLALKHRSPTAGLIVLAAEVQDALALADALPDQAVQRVVDTWPGPVTWLLPAAPWVPEWITGGRDTVAVRVSAHPVAAALCHAARGVDDAAWRPAGRRGTEGLVVSTSANRSGQAPARTASAVRRAFGTRIDTLLPGALGQRQRPSAIRDARTGRTVRD